MGEAERKGRNAQVMSNEEDECEQEEIETGQSEQTDQIIKTGAITATKGKHVIHCLTIVGQVVIIGSDEA
ncbi:MAG: hypothetical protein FWE32_00530 [Oscillospiraceae bacterium]|nr:hypothetical protein [Oscillospiraceae bacterium]